MSVSWFARGLLVGFAVAVYGLLWLLVPSLRRFLPTKSAAAGERWCFWIGFAVGIVGFGVLIAYAGVHDASPA